MLRSMWPCLRILRTIISTTIPHSPHILRRKRRFSTGWTPTRPHCSTPTTRPAPVWWPIRARPAPRTGWTPRPISAPRSSRTPWRDWFFVSMGRTRRFQLAGRFNAYNLLAAWGALSALGCDAGEALDALEQARPAPGRFERIRFEDGTHVVIDYAHTPAALEAVLEAITAVRSPNAQVWCVFGCGGDRDRTKRPMMGAVAERFADHLIVTSDNPRTEDPARIMQDIRTGLADPDRALLITDRGEAIAEAGRLARPGDIVLVAGKGHETRQIVGTDARRFDDREAVRAAFARRPPARLPQHPR